MYKMDDLSATVETLAMEGLTVNRPSVARITVETADAAISSQAGQPVIAPEAGTLVSCANNQYVGRDTASMGAAVLSKTITQFATVETLAMWAPTVNRRRVDQISV